MSRIYTRPSSYHVGLGLVPILYSAIRKRCCTYIIYAHVFDNNYQFITLPARSGPRPWCRIVRSSCRERRTDEEDANSSNNGYNTRNNNNMYIIRLRARSLCGASFPLRSPSSEDNHAWSNCRRYAWTKRESVYYIISIYLYIYDII